MRVNIVLIVLLIASLQVKGQQDFVLTGKVIDNKTKESLPHATIVYPNRSIGTISDMNGHFTLSISDANESDSIFISYMGYQAIKSTFAQCIQTKKHELKPDQYQLDEVIVSSEKFNLKTFVKDVITGYNKNRREESHIAIAHYREKAKEGNEYIMYMESLGYSIFAGKLANAAPLSNYKFFCENTKCHVISPQWVKYKENRSGYDVKNVVPAGGSNLNIFRYLEMYGLLSNKYYKKYHYKIDSTYFIGNNAVYCVAFTGKIAKGKMHVFADSKQLLKIECTTSKYWSTAFHKRVNAEVNIQFNYFEKTPFVSSILANYKNGKLEHQNYLEVLVQKFNKFQLSDKEYWSLNDFDHNPYIEYKPKEWLLYDIKSDKEYNKIESDLQSDHLSLEQQFEKYSGRWFSKNGNELAKSKVNHLKQNF